MVSEMSLEESEHKVVQIVHNPQLPGQHKIWIQVVFLYPSDAVFIWASNKASAPFGSMSLAMPSLNPARRGEIVSSTLTGIGSVDESSNRLSRILSARFRRQVFATTELSGAFPNDPEEVTDFDATLSTISSIIEQEIKLQRSDSD
ncbi:hypothetical protein SJAG_04197 [Schizosaccharomyces japonicus yFS275]|uniref:Uncharacterized protein n=1 Tax=Schizosaccharomyces japonicus (strain yFS275 / FY16936) TaxID=402676 RepID=B6K669_SCHJY|nr:hypothetical protein SJAG_04197 [Schizosaccharomyces japonicus yFS275]EEB09023.2 hypothetical protein SJAG_04197 [Schizosaccharomyces japonicus yFS275]